MGKVGERVMGERKWKWNSGGVWVLFVDEMCGVFWKRFGFSFFVFEVGFFCLG